MSLAHQIMPAAKVDVVERTPPQGIRWHPYAELFPWIDGPAYEELKADIAKNGVLEPIVFLDGAVLDGRNRYMAARDLGIEYPRVEYRGDDPLGFVISLNLKRRHLSESQRGMVASKLAKMDHGGDRRSDQAANLPVGPTQAEAARLLNVSERTLRTARHVHEAGAPELVAAVETGKVTVSAAAVIAKQDQETQKRLIAEDNLKRAASDLKRAEKAAKEAEALPKAAPLTPEEKARQEEVFGTQESRSVFIDVLNIAEKVAAFPEPAEACRTVPPALAHSFDVDAFRAVARWFDAFCNAHQEQENARVAAE